MYHFKWLLTYITLMWKWALWLVSKLACYTHFMHTIYLELGQTYNNLFCLHTLQSLLIDMANAFVSDVNISHNPCTLCKQCNFYLRHVHIQSKPSAHTISLCNQPAVILNFFNIVANRIKPTCKPCSTICSIKTKFFVMLKTWSTYAKYLDFPSCVLRGTSPTWAIGWAVSSDRKSVV